MKTARSPIAAVVVFLFISMAACQNRPNNNNTSKSGDTESTTQFVTIDGTRFVDPDGRHMIFHGVNVVNKDPGKNYLGGEGPSDFELMKRSGFNCVRLGMIWDGLEPEPGVYDDEYLKGIDQRIQWAGEHGLYVYLDMHQDLFSIKFSDGAPEWATIDDGLPHERGAIWSDSYLISPAVQTAFDHFWKNTLAQDGTGIQDHYVNAWRHVAERYAGNPVVIGYDIMNEPFMGSDANGVMPALLSAYATILVEKTGQLPPSEGELAMMWAREESRLKVLEDLSDAATYARLVDAMYEINAGFEKGALTEFYQKARDAIREVDQKHIIFIEHSYFSNTGTASALQPLVDNQGNRDKLVAYAAHGYDLVTDTKAVGNASNERVRFIFERIAETSERLNMPVMLGEWGAYYGGAPNMLLTADFAMRQIDDLLFSDTYWAYTSGIEMSSYFPALRKMYPMAVAGQLLSYVHDHDKFECAWLESRELHGPTVIYIPNIKDFSLESIEIRPEAEQIVIDEIQGSEAGYLIIAPAETDGQRNLTIRMTEESGNRISLNR